MSRYSQFLVAMLGMSILMSLGSMPIILLFATGGLGFPLIFSASGLLYGLAALPSVVLWDENTSNRVTGCIVSAILIAALALLPGTIARRAAEPGVKALTAKDSYSKPDRPITSLEIQRPQNDYSGVFEDQIACGHECRSLLMSKQIAWIRVAMNAANRNIDPPQPTTYTLLSGGDCAVLGGSVADIGSCVVVTPNTTAPADATIVVGPTNELKNRAGQSSLVEWQSTRVISVRLNKNKTSTEIVRQTEVTAKLPFLPTIIGPEIKDMKAKGALAMMSDSERFNRLSLTKTLTDLGFSVPKKEERRNRKGDPQEWEKSIDDQMTRSVISVLDLPGKQQFQQDQADLISKWLMHARSVKEWTPQLLQLLERIVRDERMKRPTDFDQIFERHPAVTKALLPVVLDMLTKNGITADYTPARQAGYRLGTVRPELLTRYADKVLALLKRDPETRDIVLPAIGRIGIDPTPHLLPFSDDLDGSIRRSHSTRTRAACLADEQWHTTLLPHLRDAFREATAFGKSAGQYRDHLLMAITRLGDRAYADEQIAAGRVGEAKQLVYKLNRAHEHAGWEDTLCYQ